MKTKSPKSMGTLKDESSVMPQQQLDYQSPLERDAGPRKRIAFLVTILSLVVAYNLLIARWKISAGVPSPVATFVDQGFSPHGNLVFGGISVAVAMYLPYRGWSLFWWLAVCIAVPLVGWWAVTVVR